MSIFGAGVGYWLKPNVIYANAKYSSMYNNKQHFKADAFQVQLIVVTDLLKKNKEIENFKLNNKITSMIK